MLHDCGFLKHVSAAYQLSVDRQALFADLASCGWSEARCEKLRVLERLENQTVTLLAGILERANHITSRVPAARVRRRARALADGRWIEMIEALANEHVQRVAQLEHLERVAPGIETRHLARGTAHLIALQMFLRLELAGRGRESIRPALALIPADPLPLAAAAG